MSKKLFFRFSGIDNLVELRDCADVAVFFPSLFQNWPYEIVTNGDKNLRSVLVIEKCSSEYTISSILYDDILTLNDPLSIACSLVADLAWARLDQQPDLLCFHGAAVEFNGQLVLFPDRYRAGKSTLTACLSAIGKKVFTDDYLPLELSKNGTLLGMANGAAPRMRLPIPGEFSENLKNYIKKYSGPENKQYLYLRLKDELLANYNERLPISTIVLLDRQDDTYPELREAQPSEILRRLIKQNFSRSMNPARILELLGILVSSSKLKVLSYSNAEEASEFLDREFTKDTAIEKVKAIKLKSPDRLHASIGNAEYALPSFEIGKKFTQSESVIELAFKDDSFVASSNGTRIHHLDIIAKAVWLMFETPTAAFDIIQVFKEAFPEQSEKTIQTDIMKTVSDFARRGLLDAS